MRFMVTFTYKPEQRQATVERFLETGAPAPDGVKMLGRWHDAGLHQGWALAESDSVEAVALWSKAWNDLLTLEVIPVLDDEEAARVLGS